MNENFKKQFTGELIHWYQINKRDLPFRENNDPYRIWISEIMLQQTQVQTVIPYFNRFINLFPTIDVLAQASVEEVLKAWDGLGYYSRVKNIHKTAKEIVLKYNGVFPSDYETILSLKGIGSYTAGAISSIAFHHPKPAVDGNVMRVLSRILTIWDDISLPKTKLKFEAICGELISKDNPSDFTQGLMELGALICKPVGQKCMECPLRFLCLAYKEGLDEKLPIKSKKTKQEMKKYITGIIVDEKDNFLLRKRPSEGMLANYWELVQIEGKHFEDLQHYLMNHDGIKIQLVERFGESKYIFTHQIWNMMIFKAVLLNGPLPSHFGLFSREQLNEINFSTAHKKILTRLWEDV